MTRLKVRSEPWGMSAVQRKNSPGVTTGGHTTSMPMSASMGLTTSTSRHSSSPVPSYSLYAVC